MHKFRGCLLGAAVGECEARPGRPPPSPLPGGEGAAGHRARALLGAPTAGCVCVQGALHTPGVLLAGGRARSHPEPLQPPEMGLRYLHCKGAGDIVRRLPETQEYSLRSKEAKGLHADRKERFYYKNVPERLFNNAIHLSVKYVTLM